MSGKFTRSSTGDRSRPPNRGNAAPPAQWVVDTLATALEPYVGARAEFIARNIAPRVTAEIFMVVDQAIATTFRRKEEQ